MCCTKRWDLIGPATSYMVPMTMIFRLMFVDMDKLNIINGGHVWRSTRKGVGGGDENLSDVSLLFFLPLGMNEKDGSSSHRAKGADSGHSVLQWSAEASGQQITFHAWEPIYKPLDFLICASKKISPLQTPPSSPSRKEKAKRQEVERMATEGSAVDWIVRLMASLCLNISAHFNDCLMTSG